MRARARVCVTKLLILSKPFGISTNPCLLFAPRTYLPSQCQKIWRLVGMPNRKNQKQRKQLLQHRQKKQKQTRWTEVLAPAKKLLPPKREKLRQARRPQGKKRLLRLRNLGEKKRKKRWRWVMDDFPNSFESFEENSVNFCNEHRMW